MIGLLNQTATVYLPITSESMGREVADWERVGTVECRFTQPATSLLQLTTGANIEHVDYAVFAELEFANLITVEDDGQMVMTTPVRLSIQTAGCIEMFEMKNLPRVIRAAKKPHHVEFGVVRVVQ